MCTSLIGIGTTNDLRFASLRYFSTSPATSLPSRIYCLSINMTEVLKAAPKELNRMGACEASLCIYFYANCTNLGNPKSETGTKHVQPSIKPCYDGLSLPAVNTGHSYCQTRGQTERSFAIARWLDQDEKQDHWTPLNNGKAV